MKDYDGFFTNDSDAVYYNVEYNFRLSYRLRILMNGINSIFVRKFLLHTLFANILKINGQESFHNQQKILSFHRQLKIIRNIKILRFLGG